MINLNFLILYSVWLIYIVLRDGTVSHFVFTHPLFHNSVIAAHFAVRDIFVYRICDCKCLACNGDQLSGKSKVCVNSSEFTVVKMCNN